MEAELGEVSEIGENEFLSIFQNWLISMSNSDGSYFDQSFADMCSSSFSAVDISLLSQGHTGKTFSKDFAKFYKFCLKPLDKQL